MNKPLALAAAVVALFTVAGARAQASAGDHAAHHPATTASTAPAAAASTAASPLAEGEVRRIDIAQKKVTLRHGPIASLDMPPMTMVFQVADDQQLGALKVGDKVRFAVQKVDAAFVVTSIEKAPE